MPVGFNEGHVDYNHVDVENFVGRPQEGPSKSALKASRADGAPLLTSADLNGKDSFEMRPTRELDLQQKELHKNFLTRHASALNERDDAFAQPRN